MVAQAAPPAVDVSHMTATPSGVTLEWKGPTNGWTFTVQTRFSLGGGGWSNAAGAWPAATNQWTSPAPADPQAFYRVVATPPSTDRGAVVSAAVAGTFSASTITALAHFAGITLAATQSVTAYHIVYKTIDAFGAPTIASGEIAVPQHVETARPVVIYMHGTVSQKTDVPSQLNLEGLLGVAFAAEGYVAEAPDYLGLGDSPGTHPYLHAASEASAGVDLMRAARRFCASNQIPISKRLFVSGYSQGGHASVALLRELESNETNEFTVTACAAGAGPYDMSVTTANDALSGRTPPDPYYFPYVLSGYQWVYGLVPNFADLFVAPYDTTLPPLFDGTHSGDEINAAMPADPKAVLKPEFVADFRSNPANPLHLALLDNDLIRWTPRTPLRLYACSGDQDVLPANAVVAQAAFAARGDTNVVVLDPDPGASHTACAVPAVFAWKDWFDTFLP
jgi:dienelactone hydrolase